jgi:hypothetical protein
MQKIHKDGVIETGNGSSAYGAYKSNKEGFA